MAESQRPTIAILASGEGTTAEAFIRATQLSVKEGGVDADVGLVVCNNPPGSVGIYDKVERLNKEGFEIDILSINSKTHPAGPTARGQTQAESAAICQEVTRRGCAHVALMGYMKVVRGELLEEYGWLPTFGSAYQARMSNTHPGPLPETRDTYGLNTSQKVLKLGLRTSKHTVHLVGIGVDTGPILAEHEVIIDRWRGQPESAESLFEKVKAVERDVLPSVIGRFLREQREFRAGLRS